MEIRNIYSSYDNYGYEDEKLYSVLMDEDEVSLFSELQKEFGLVKAANKAARKAYERSMAAGQLRSLGMEVNPRRLADRISLNRAKTIAQASGSKLEHSGLDYTYTIGSPKKLSLNQKINARGVDYGRMVPDPDRVSKTHEFMTGDRTVTITSNHGSDRQTVWDRMRGKRRRS